jgi:VanZ family protein
LRLRLGLGIALIVGVVLLLHVLPIGGASRVWGELLDAAHVVGFSVLAFAAARFCMSDRTRLDAAQSLLYAGAFAAVLAMTSELAQIPTGRDANLGDLYRDAAGITAGLLAAAGLDFAAWRAALLVLAFAALGFGLRGPAKPLTARVAAQVRFPVLMDFDGVFEEPLIERMSAHIEVVDAPPNWPIRGKVAKVEPRGNWRYEGISFFGLPEDWSGYEAVQFLIATEKPVHMSLTVRVHDRAHNNEYADRFNRAIDVGPEPVLVRIPLEEIRNGPSTRKLDMTQIDDFTIFATAPYESGFYLDDVRLE